MKILVVNWQDRRNPQAGGAEIHLHEVFRRIAAAGDEVTFLVSGFRGAAAEEVIDGIRVVRVGGRHSFPFVVARAYRRRWPRPPFDVVVEALNKIPVWTPRWTQRPVVLLVHHLFGTTAFVEASWPMAAAVWLAERPLPRIYDGVPIQAISHSTAADLRSRGLRRGAIEVIPPGVDVDFFSPDPAARAPDPVFVYVGRLKRYKRLEMVLEGFARLRHPRAELWIVGQGDYEPALRRVVAQLGVQARVRWWGYVPEETKRACLRAAWAHVYPSPKEGWGIANVEAAACGTPAIASDAPGLRESVIAERTGLLVSPHDPDAWAAALARLAADRAWVDELGRQARAFAETLRWETTAARTRAHLQRCLGVPVHDGVAVP